MTESICQGNLLQTTLQLNVCQIYLHNTRIPLLQSGLEVACPPVRFSKHVKVLHMDGRNY